MARRFDRERDLPEPVLAVHPVTRLIASVSPLLEEALGLAPGGLKGRPLEDLKFLTPPAVIAESLMEFSSRAGHDLTGPLNQAGSLLALFVKRYRNQLDGEADVLLHHLENAALRMDAVVIDVRRYLSVAGSPPYYSPCDLNSALSAALVPLKGSVAQSGAIVDSGQLPEIEADTNQMVALFEILIGNAIKFRRPSILPRIYIRASRSGEQWIVTVEDNGVGIEPEHQVDVLLPFRRLNGREYPGTGLGLAIANLIVASHRGTIQLASAPGGGTTVSFSLPCR